MYAPELAIIEQKLIQDATKGDLKKYIHAKQLDKLKKMSPFSVINDLDMETITNPEHFGVTDRKIKLLRKKSDYKEKDTDTIHIVFSVEGCHSLCNKVGGFNKNDIINNIDTLRQKISLLSVNLTHMEQSPVCNHAFGMQFLKDKRFFPTGKGISEMGISITRHCYQNKIMIDVKHMSLAARKQLYQLRKQNDFSSINQPIVCTHAGFTGISFAHIPRYILKFEKKKNAKYFRVLQGKALKYGQKYDRPAFNTSSINLYDEEIIEILESGGILGLSLDKRILGFQPHDKNPKEEFPIEEEFISVDEIEHFYSSSPGKAFNDGQCQLWSDLEEAGPVYTDDYHLRYFMAHLLHLITVARKNNYDLDKALKQVCIGSDFDGLINPVACCDTMDEIYYLKLNFEKDFEDFAKERKVKLPDGFDIKEFSEDLFFRNGRDFVLSRLELL